MLPYLLYINIFHVRIQVNAVKIMSWKFGKNAVSISLNIKNNAIIVLRFNELTLLVTHRSTLGL